MANRPGSLGLLEALKMAQDRYEAEQASKPKAAPFNFGQTVRDADKAIQAGVFGATDFVGHEAQRLWDGGFGTKALAETLPKLMQSGPSNLADALATTRQGGAKWSFDDLQAQRDRDNLGTAAGGALDATWLLPAVPAAKAGGRIAGDVLGDASSVVAKGVRKLGYEPIPNQNALGVFGGPLAKTADHKALDLAKSLEKAGKPREEIWSQTGWFKGVDGKWRFEIDDSAFQPKSDAMFRKDGVMSDFFDDADSGGAYPELADSPTVRMKKSSLFNPKTGAIGFTGRGQKGRSGALHERQHAIQEKEGFASGGSPDFSHKFDDVETWKVYEANQQELRDILDSVDVWGLKKRQKNIEDLARGVYPESMTARLSKEDSFRPPSDNELPFLQRFDELAAAQKEIQSRNRMLDPVEGYARLAGEVEARNVQKRMNLTPDQRRAAPPWTTQDVPDEKQFVLFDRMNPNAGFPFSGKDGEKPLLSALMDAFKGKKAPAPNPLDQFTPPTSIDDIFTGGSPRGAREITGGAENPAGLEGGFMHDPRFNGPQQPVPYNPESGFGGLDARLGKQTLPEGVSAIPNPPDLPPSMSGEANYRIELKSGPPVNVRISGRDGRITWEFADQAIPENKVAAGKEAVRRVQEVLAYHSKIAPDQTFYFEGATPAHSKLYDALLGRDSGGYDVSRKPGAGGFEKTVIAPATDKNARTLSEALAKARKGDDSTLGMGAPFEGKGKPLGYNDWAPEWRAAYDKGLDMSQEARMARAREQGFTTPAYRGMREPYQEDVAADNIQMFSADPRIASIYAGNEKGSANVLPALIKTDNFSTVNAAGRPWDDIPLSTLPDDLSSSVAFRHMQGRANPTTNTDMINFAADDAGRNGVVFRGLREADGKAAPTDTFAVFDPANIRSVNAAFDPDNIGKANLLGMGRAAVDSDLIKLLMAYGAFGGMSAGALATMDAQKHQQGGM